MCARVPDGSVAHQINNPSRVSDTSAILDILHTPPTHLSFVEKFILSAFAILVWIFFGFSVLGQADSYFTEDSTRQAPKVFRDWWQQGRTQGHARLFSSYIDNDDDLLDNYGTAIALAIRYESPYWRNLKVTFGGSVVYDIFSSDLSRRDPQTNAADRYIVAMYDLTNPTNKNQLVRLEELNLQYAWGEGRRSRITWGKQIITMPFVNSQDSRLRPSMVEGLWANIVLGQRWRTEGGWLYGASPRGTQRWYGMGQSLGILSGGLNFDGSRVDYAENIESKGYFLASLHYRPSAQTAISVYNHHLENVFNLAIAQAEHTLTLNETQQLLLGVQTIRQDAVADGGNPNPRQAYIEPGSHVWLFAGRVEWQHQQTRISLNHTRVGDTGRFLMPREWGTEGFLYGFMRRERFDGYGQVSAWNLYAHHQHRQLFWEGGIGYYQMPDVRNIRLNKYGMPTYWRANLELNYLFANSWQGLSLQLLLVYKGALGEWYDDNRYRINKVDMWLHTLALNYRF